MIKLIEYIVRFIITLLLLLIYIGTTGFIYMLLSIVYWDKEYIKLSETVMEKIISNFTYRKKQYYIFNSIYNII